MTVFRNKFSRRGVAVLALSLVALLFSVSVAAYAYWGLSSSSTISVSAGSVQAPSVSCDQVNRNLIRINWSGNPSNGVTGYVLVTATSSGSTTQNFGPTTRSTTDAAGSNLIVGSTTNKTYTVTAQYGSWNSPESSTSASARNGGLLSGSSITCR